MKTPRLPALLLFLSLALPAFLRAAEPVVIPVAVLDFESNDPKLKERGGQLATLVAAQLSTRDNVVVVERQEISKLLAEQELGASGMVDPASAAKIGHLTGARVLVVGRVFTVAGETTAALKVMSTETSRVHGVTESFSADSAPSAPAAQLAAKISDILASKAATLAAPADSADDRIARLKRELADKPLPSVAISISEEHIGDRVIDPAAETEVGRILGQAGFTVLTGEAAAKADYEIRGEAFSETGVRRGTLVSCRARVEVKAVARDTGRAALVDRQVAWGVDTAEHVAGKKALQDAGAALAVRLASALTAKP